MDAKRVVLTRRGLIYDVAWIVYKSLRPRSLDSGRQEVSRRRTRGQSEDSVARRRQNMQVLCALKVRIDITRIPKQGHLQPHKKDWYLPFFFKKKSCYRFCPSYTLCIGWIFGGGIMLFKFYKVMMMNVSDRIMWSGSWKTYTPFQNKIFCTTVCRSNVDTRQQPQMLPKALPGLIRVFQVTKVNYRCSECQPLRYLYIWWIAFLPPATKLGQGYIFTGICDSVNREGVLPLGGGGFLWGGASSQGGVLPPGGCFLPGWIACWRPPSPRTATAAGGTHPTGMHSCFNCIFLSIIKRSEMRAVFYLHSFHEFFSNTSPFSFRVQSYNFVNKTSCTLCKELLGRKSGIVTAVDINCTFDKFFWPKVEVYVQ